MKKTFYTLFALLLAMSVLLAACGQPAAATQPTEAPVQPAATDAATAESVPVTMTMWSRDSDQALVEGLVKKWNASHKNQIETTIIPASDFVTKFGVAVAGGAAPDIIAIDLIYVPAFAAPTR